jgi:aminoglycoside phosphotransferase (APT) family kinase protein
MSDVIVAPETRDLEDLARSLAEWMGGKLPDASDVYFDNLTYPRGAGQSHETILFDAHWKEGGEERTQGLVVRIKPGSFTVFVDTLFEQQFGVMKVLSDGGYVRVAKPLWLESDPAVLGKPFFVMEKMHGRVPVSIPPYRDTGWVAEATPEQRRHMWEGGVRQLAAVQSVPLSEIQFLAGPEHAREGLAQEWDKYTRFLAWIQEERPWPVLEAAMARLENMWPDNQPPGLVWGDARLGNMMFDDNFDVVAVMDWEQPSLGGALNDLGWFLVLSEVMHGTYDGKPHLEGMGTREETIALWEEITGLSSRDVEWFEDFTRLKMSMTGIRMAAMRGTPMPDNRGLAKRLKVPEAA